MHSAQLINLIYSRQWLRRSLHILFWILMAATRYYLVGISFNVYNGFPADRQLLLTLCSTATMALFYYCLVYQILPLLSAKRYLLFAFAIPALMIIYVLADTWIEHRLIFSCADCLKALQTNNRSYYEYLRLDLTNIALKRLLSLGSVLALIFTISIPFGIKMALRAFKDQLHAMQLSEDKLRLELNFLKAQLNPHFLFNSMNNIYGLILRGNTEHSANLVARLSNLLRYMLYESNHDTMAATKELQLLRDYTELEALRLNDIRVNTDLQTDGSIDKLPPLLFIPLLENAFKFCPDDPGATIDLKLHISEKRLTFCLSNTLSTQQQHQAGNGHTGIGALNFKRRMEMYYTGKYHYHCVEENNTYISKLMIDLS